MDAKTQNHLTSKGVVVEIEPDQELFGSGENPNDLLSLAWEQEAIGLIIHASALSPSFFDLKTGIAGEVLQKMVNYNCPSAFVIPDLSVYDIRIRELAHDHRRHPLVRFFDNEGTAHDWLQTR